MRTDEFVRWLTTTPQPRGELLARSAADGYASYCAKVEQGLRGDIDAAFDLDELAGWIATLRAGETACAKGDPPPAWLVTKGNPAKRLAILRSGVQAYFRFRRAGGQGGASGSASQPSTDSRARRSRKASPWPDWGAPTDDELRLLAESVARHVRFLSPDFVRAIAQGIERDREPVAARLDRLGIASSPYLWPAGTCAFPGVRRHEGRAEQNAYHDETPAEAGAGPALLRLDKNTYPKHVWSFALRGREVREKFGPRGFELAHLADHKPYHNRCGTEFAGLDGSVLPGLYTSPWNTVYVPKAFLRATDAGDSLRRLLQRRAFQLYGGACALLPCGAQPAEEPRPEWSVERFSWTEPVGDACHAEAFLKFRTAELERLFLAVERRPAARGE